MLKRVVTVFALVTALFLTTSWLSTGVFAQSIHSTSTTYSARPQSCLGATNNVTVTYTHRTQADIFHCTGTYGINDYVSGIYSNSWSGYVTSYPAGRWPFCNNSRYDLGEELVYTIELSPTRIC